MALSQSLSNIRYQSDHYFWTLLIYSAKGETVNYIISLAIIMRNKTVIK